MEGFGGGDGGVVVGSLPDSLKGKEMAIRSGYISYFDFLTRFPFFPIAKPTYESAVT